MIVLGLDTATPATAVGLRLAGGQTLQAYDPGLGERPGHATRLLPLAGELLAEAGLRWSALERIAVGLGPGTFTGLRIGVASARGLAQTLGVELVGVSTLRALAVPGLERREAEVVLAVIDARRGEAFAAAYAAGEHGQIGELVPPRVLNPENLGSVVEEARGVVEGFGREAPPAERWLAVGDGAVRFRGHLEAAGVAVAHDASPLHRVSGRAICELAVDRRSASAPARGLEAIVPDYGRRPDAEIALEGAEH
jgi:tRNA threonylcarbamoyladenosine biosynthesis protein TsaB